MTRPPPTSTLFPSPPLSRPHFPPAFDPKPRHTIERGQRLTELLKQPQYSPYAIWQMYAALLAATRGCFDHVPLDKVKLALEAILRELKASQGKLIDSINTGDKPTDEQNE